ncbi:MAG TPA: hypothetical protein VGP76_13105 [Planctomycetaceae bacterium]|jgi:hypothetical protein|nr:hypothetical protein [Planctomycetaceae bacterium]
MSDEPERVPGGGGMTDEKRSDLVRHLGDLMSAISEECYCAGWLGGTEFTVPELCRRAAESGKTQFWGHGRIDPSQARQLAAIANQIGSWVNTDDASTGYVPFQPFPIPLEYVEAIERETAT